jgi:predicted nuclease with RNAse H fold
MAERHHAGESGAYSRRIHLRGACAARVTDHVFMSRDAFFAKGQAGPRRTLMSTHPSLPVVVGVDVGGVNKGFHVVAMCDRRLVRTFVTPHAGAVVDWCLSVNASLVGIDAPCSWSLSGRARSCERALAAERIRAFATPTATVGATHRFYRWMLNGADLFRLLAPHYRLFDGRHSPASPVCFETFPQAVACALARRVLSAKHKRLDRPRLLRQAGLNTDLFKTIDEVDAALCALAAHYLSLGRVKTYGDGTEGFIVVPQVSWWSRQGRRNGKGI